MDINRRTVSLIQAIARLITDSGLPPCVVGLVLDKLRTQVEALESRALQAELQALEDQRPQGSEAEL